MKSILFGFNINKNIIILFNILFLQELMVVTTPNTKNYDIYIC